jgi:hypothetical protein
MVDLGRIMSLHITITLAFLFGYKILHVHHFGSVWDTKRLLGLHLKQVLADFIEC